MNVVSFPARPARTYRHQMYSLTYVTLDRTKGGIVRNLSHQGVALQAVGGLRPQQRVRLRFELTSPRMHVEADGEVSWSTSSGRCGIHFVDMPVSTKHDIDRWIFSNLIDAATGVAASSPNVLESLVISIARAENAREENLQNLPEADAGEIAAEQNDGLLLSAAPRPVICLEPSSGRRENAQLERETTAASDPNAQLNWLSRPLSGRTVARLVDSLAVIAALFLFALIFLGITHELPPWPLTLGAASAAAVLVAASYWLLFAIFGSGSPGARLAQAATGSEKSAPRANNQG